MDSRGCMSWRSDSSMSKGMSGHWTDPESQFRKEWGVLRMSNLLMQEPRAICVQMLQYAKQSGSELVGFGRAEPEWSWGLERVRHPRSDLLTRAQHQQWQAVQVLRQRDGGSLERRRFPSRQLWLRLELPCLLRQCILTSRLPLCDQWLELRYRAQQLVSPILQVLQCSRRNPRLLPHSCCIPSLDSLLRLALCSLERRVQ